jgi:predicted SprT family Zn-dependent metalloprotease
VGRLKADAVSAAPSRPCQLELFCEGPPSDAPGAEQAALQARYDALAAEWRLPPARVVLTARRATGGLITYGPPHVIRVSRHMAGEDRHQTLLHEAAHAICFARWGVAEGHSPRFWAIARTLGVARKSAPETERLRRVREANARYAYRCPGCAAEWTRRKPFSRARLCAACDRAGRPSRLILVRRPKRAARKR